MICDNFWCKGQFENKPGEYWGVCPHCRQEYPGQVEIVKKHVSIGYSLKEILDMANNKKNNKNNNNKNNPKK